MSNMHFLYAFIYDTPNFPNPFLVHISRKTRTDLAMVQCYEPNVIYCPKQMNNILKSILYDLDIFKFRSLVKNELFFLLKEKDISQFSEAFLCDIFVSSIIKN